MQGVQVCKSQEANGLVTAVLLLRNPLTLILSLSHALCAKQPQAFRQCVTVYALTVIESC